MFQDKSFGNSRLYFLRQCREQEEEGKTRVKWGWRNRDEVRMERGRCHCAPKGTNAAYLSASLLPKTAPNMFYKTGKFHTKDKLLTLKL